MISVSQTNGHEPGSLRQACLHYGYMGLYPRLACSTHHVGWVSIPWNILIGSAVSTLFLRHCNVDSDAACKFGSDLHQTWRSIPLSDRLISLVFRSAGFHGGYPFITGAYYILLVGFHLLGWSSRLSTPLSLWGPTCANAKTWALHVLYSSSKNGTLILEFWSASRNNPISVPKKWETQCHQT